VHHLEDFIMTKTIPNVYIVECTSIGLVHGEKSARIACANIATANALVAELERMVPKSIPFASNIPGQDDYKVEIIPHANPKLEEIDVCGTPTLTVRLTGYNGVDEITPEVFDLATMPPGKMEALVHILGDGVGIEMSWPGASETT
jgi:hypothetical protein